MDKEHYEQNKTFALERLSALLLHQTPLKYDDITNIIDVLKYSQWDQQKYEGVKE